MRVSASGDNDVRADRVAAWATGAGFGLVVFMLNWLVWNRVLLGILPTPAGPLAAMVIAVVSGGAAGVLQGRRLARRFR